MKATNVAPAGVAPDSKLAQSTIRTIMRRVLPFLVLLYLTAYIDRSNVSFAALSMTSELHFSPTVFGFGAGVFFFSYLVLSIPGTLVVEWWGARKWVAVILVTWGIVASCTSLIQTDNQFYAMRLLLGLGEGGFFPCMIVFLTHWFRQADRGKAASLFFLAIPMSQIIAGPFSAVLLKIDWLGYSGWRWLLFFEGIPAVLLGVIAWFYLTDKPSQATWLSDDQRRWMEDELGREKALKASGGHTFDVGQAFRSRNVLLLAGACFCFESANYGLIIWLPKMVAAASGQGASITSLLSTIPFIFGVPAVLFAGWYSDRKKERRNHAAAYLALIGCGLLLSTVPGLHWGFTIFCLGIAAFGINAFNPVFYMLPSSLLAGSAAAAAVGFVSLIGHLGGFAGPYAMGLLTVLTGSYRGGVWFFAACAFVGSLLLLTIRKADVASGAAPSGRAAGSEAMAIQTRRS